MSDSGDTYHGDEVAVIGMACRLPGASSPAEYWRNLRGGVESITRYSEDELLAAGIDPALLSSPDYVKSGGGVIDGIDQFDAAFFGMVPRDAEILDPQQRLFLEAAYEALEHAGYDPARTDGLVGVFAGAGRVNYLLENLASHPDLLAGVGPVGVTVATDKDFLPTRVSYELNLRGPSVNVQTACSTSLVATHMACQSLLTGDCDIALAGGVSITTLRKTGYLYHDGGIYSRDGHCRAFDADATGMVGGNGLAIVVLKRLESALEDGDTIWAVIKGSAINNDGSAKVGFVAPGVDGQAQAISDALDVAKVDARTITCIEAHGTGTALGDPIEIAALTAAFRADTDDRGFCAVGAVKTNIGHTNAAAGVAGLIKAVLALRHREIPPSLHFERPNPQIDFAGSPFYVNAALQRWDAEGMPRRAGVSSFGMGGTNAHLILEEAPERVPAAAPVRGQHLLVLSAKTSAALEAATDRLAEHLDANPGEDLADVEYTLQVGRGVFTHRRAIACGGAADAVAALRARDPARVATGSRESEEPSVAFLFPGQGAQHVGMGRDLYESEPGFRAAVDTCAELLSPHLDLDLRGVLYPDASAADQAQAVLGQTWLTQPALFVIEYALAVLWAEWGVRPGAMIGHSVGEYVAACLAGVLTLEDALVLVAARGRMMQDLPAGDMLSVGLPEAEVVPLLAAELSLAASNAPSACVVSGPADAVGELHRSLEAREVPCRVLHTSHAFHSSMMDAIVEPFAALVRGVELAPASSDIVCISTVTGRRIDPEEWADPDYWVRNLREPVRFSAGVVELLEDGECVLLEVGPGQTLSSLVRQQGAAVAGRTVIASMRHPREEASDLGTLLTALGRLWIAGVSPDWKRFHGEAMRRRVPLPTYAFDRQRYWVERGAAVAAPATLGKRTDIADWFYVPSWQRADGAPAEPAVPAGGVLLFVDQLGIAERLATRLAGERTVTVRTGDAYRALGGDRYEIRPDARADYDALLADVSRGGPPPAHVVHLWSCVSPQAREIAAEALASTQERGFYSLMFALQALVEAAPDREVSVQVVSNDLFEVTGREAVHPERATVLGPTRAAPYELENVRCRHVDVHLPTGEAGWTELIDQLLAEGARKSDDAVVAYRGPHRWLPSFEPTRLEANDAPSRSGGTYLITGGLGGVGLVLAGRLAELDRGCKLVLVSRSASPGPAVTALEELGAEVAVLRGDVADAAQMEQVIRGAIERFGAIHGVVHAAGLSTGGVIAMRTAEAAAEVLAPKVRGTLVLADLLRDQPLDFFALCSSLASVQGGVGAADYCGANAFLDLLAESRGREIPFVTLSWDAWSEVGMAAETDAPEAMQRERAEYLALGLRSVEGAEAFTRVLRSGRRHVYVSTRDLPARLAQARGAAAPAEADVEAATEAEVGAAAHARPDLPNPYVAPDSDAEKTVAGAWVDVLGVDRPGTHDNFFELGGHSLLLWQLRNKLQKSFDTDLSIADMFQHPTIATMAEHLAGETAAPSFGEVQDRASKQRAAMSRRGKAARKGRGGKR